MKPTLKIQERFPLAPLTSFQIGGEARFFVRATTESEVAETVKFAAENDLELFVLGGGSNVLISDRGFDGMVLQIGILGLGELLPRENGTTLITVGAGEDWDRFVEYCVANNLSGVECLSGIPGFVGGTPVQNVGAYGQEVAETITEVRCLDRRSGDVLTLRNEECEFTYRTSIFNSSHRDRFIVLSVKFALSQGGVPNISYRDLKAHFGDTQPSITQVREAVLSIRRRKSMVIDRGDPNSRGAGSFFKNPIITKDKLEQIRTTFEDVPSFDYGDMVKLPAAWLIEQAGFKKGYSVGSAGISANHTLALINRGDANSADIIVLMELVQEKVADVFGIKLDPEPIFIGF